MSWPSGVPSPQSVSEIDAGTVRDIHRLRWLILSVVAVMLMAAVVLLAVGFIHENQIVTRQRKEISASCSFYRDLAPLPVANAPGSQWPSKVSVTLIHDSRAAYLGLVCSGPLPPPDRTFIRGAVHYGLGVPR